MAIFLATPSRIEAAKQLAYNNDMRERGHRIRQARRALRLSQDELAARLGWSQPYVSQLENGQKGIDTDKIKALADQLGVTVTFLLYGELTEQHGNRSLVPSGRAIPMLSIEQAASGQSVESADKSQPLYANFPCSSESWWAFIPDDSNGPMYPKGAKAIFDPQESATPGSIVLAVHGQDTTPIIGQLSFEASSSGRVTVVTPLNQRWSPARSDIEPVSVIAVLTEVSRVVPR